MVLSSWSSGSSAVTGFLGAAGAYLCPPYVVAKDDLTPNTYESADFRGMLLATMGELSLEYRVDPAVFQSAFGRWYLEQIPKAEAAGATRIALKHPMSILMMDQIRTVCNPQFLVVTRPFAAIERTRLRRDWHAVYGEQGAQELYNRIYSYLHAHDLPYASIPYARFLDSPAERLRILDYLELDVTDAEAEAAFVQATTR